MKLPVSLLFAACAAVLSFNAHAQAAKPDLAKGAAAYGQVCVACHAADGNSAIVENPKLAQQHPEYLVKQLHEFKSGKRDNAIMKGFASALSDEDMRNIGFWLASQKATTGVAQNKDSVRLGEASTAVASRTARSPRALVATAPTVPASQPSTPVWRVSTLVTPRRNSRPSATACATTTSR